jgi:hypothetical protein
MITSESSIPAALTFLIAHRRPFRWQKFETQISRPLIEANDPGRDYGDRAEEQLLNLQGRDFVPKQNERLVMLEVLNLEQKAMLAKLKPPGKVTVARKSFPVTFAAQLCSEKANTNFRTSDAFPDSKYKIEVLKSLKKKKKNLTASPGSENYGVIQI